MSIFIDPVLTKIIILVMIKRLGKVKITQKDADEIAGLSLIESIADDGSVTLSCEMFKD